VAVQINPAASLEVRIPQKLFDVFAPLYRGDGAQFDVAPDGQRFVFLQLEAGTAAASPMQAVTNWTAALRSR
jgi:hypothetical protein